MKQIIIIAVVIIAIAGVVLLKKSKSGCETENSVCPCKMIEAAQSNETESGASNID